MDTLVGVQNALSRERNTLSIPASSDATTLIAFFASNLVKTDEIAAVPNCSFCNKVNIDRLVI